MTVRPEAVLSRQVRKALALHGVPVYSTEAPRHRGPSGSTPGVPDLILLPRSGTTFVELKVGANRPTVAQAVFADRSAAAGTPCLVWRHVDDCLAWLVSVGLRGREL